MTTPMIIGSARGAFSVPLVLLVTLLLAGCAQQRVHPLVSQPLYGPLRVEVSMVTRLAADAMLMTIGNRLRHREKIIPASFVEEGNFNKTSPLGRLLARQMAARFTQAGFSVVEIKLSKNFRLRQGEGQFALTRELKKIAQTQKAHAILAGSYVTAKNQLYVHAQLIRLRDGVALASENFNLPLTHNLRILLGQNP